MTKVGKFMGRALILAALGVVAPSAYAEQGTDTPSTTQQPQDKPVMKRGGGQRPGGLEQRLQRLSSRLNLSEDQKKQIRPILDEELGQLKDLRNDTKLSKEEKRTKFKEIANATFDKIHQLLTPEQQKKHDELRQQALERREKRGAPARNN